MRICIQPLACVFMCSPLSKPFIAIRDVALLYMQRVTIASLGVVKKIVRSLFFKLFLIACNLIARVVCKMTKLDSFVQCNLFCCKTKVKSVQVHICPKLKEKGIDCKGHFFIITHAHCFSKCKLTSCLLLLLT